MPANTKYLEKSVVQRIAKITAAFAGGFIVSSSCFVLLAGVFREHRPEVLITYYYGGFLLWMPLILFSFLFRNGWKCWLLYLTVSLLLSIGSLIFN